MMTAILIALMPETILMGISAAACYFSVHSGLHSEVGTGHFVETSWGWEWVGDPCSCRGRHNACPQCDVTGNFRVFLYAFACVFVTAAMVYLVLRLAAFTACGRPKHSRRIQYGQAVAALVAGSFAMCGAFLPLPGYVADEPFCRDDDCASLLVMCPIWLGGLAALVCACRSLAGQGRRAVSARRRHNEATAMEMKNTRQREQVSRTH
mmetsp:Transcript_114841/g.357717  ORF Transcript_114841/g.357717 Transcript_114841/m.357717 type:complete len:208 (-) Transcript_114841:240-863(-)